MYKLQEITERTIWEQSIQSYAPDYYPLFQSWEWGEIQQALGKDIFRFAVLGKNEKVLLVGMVVIIDAKRGKYLHVRHGPLYSPKDKKVFDFFIDQLRMFGKERNMSFIRVSPLMLKDTVPDDFFLSRGFYNAPVHNMDAEICWVLDITLSEEQLLANMRKSHRYLIKKAQKMDIEIIRTENVDDIKEFIKIYEEFFDFKHITPHTGLMQEYEVFHKNNHIELFIARYQGSIISGALIVYIGDTAIYHHSASIQAYRNLPASYLIQWEAIREAKKRGKKIYNFWGIAPENKPNHPWKGLTLFKTGFGGRRVEFVHAKDLPLSFAYAKTYIIESLWKLRKGY